MESMKRAANRYHSQKIDDEKEKAEHVLSSEDVYASNKGIHKFDEKASPLIEAKNPSALELLKLDLPFSLDNCQSNVHWGGMKDVESPHGSYKKIKKIQNNLGPAFTIQRDTDIEEKGDVPVEMANLREIRRFQPINKELTTANWMNAVLLKPFKQADERSKAQYQRYISDTQHYLQGNNYSGIEENFDSIYQRMLQKAERKDSFMRGTSMPSQMNNNFMRPHSASINLQGDGQGEQKDAHGEITSLHTRVTKSKILVIIAIDY